MDDSAPSTPRPSSSDQWPAADPDELQSLREQHLRLQGEYARGSIAVRKILDSIPVGVAYVDADACYQFINDTYSRVFGLAGDSVGRRVRDVHAPDRWKRMRAAVGRALKGEPQSFEWHLDAKDERSVELVLQYLPRVDEESLLQGFFILMEDVTARREDARKLEWSELLLREALSSASMMAWEWDMRSRTTTRTSNAEQVLGFVPEATQISIAQHIHPDDVPLTRDILLDSVRQLTPFVVQFRFHRDDAQWRWLETRATPRLTESGDVVVRGLISDITERHELDLARRANEERLRIAQRVGRLGAWQWDLTTNAVSWSPEMEALHGLAEGEFGGSFEEFLARVHPEDRAATLAAVNDLQTKGSHEIEHRIVLPDGSQRWLYGRGELFHDEKGTPTHALGVAMDITERRQAAEVRERLVEDLQAANAAKDELLALVSHELRTPLTTLGGTASVLLRHGDRIDPASREAALRDIERGAQRLEQIIGNMLTLAHAEGVHPEILEPVLLRRVIASELAEQHVRVPELQAALHTPDELFPVLGNDTYVRQILGNLLSNAGKYGGGSPIDVTLERLGEEVIVTIADRGKGIADDEMSRVFEPFFRSKQTARGVSGIGLGLTVCKRLVELQGGRIWCEPREGGGAAFKFSLPIVEP